MARTARLTRVAGSLPEGYAQLLPDGPGPRVVRWAAAIAAYESGTNLGISRIRANIRLRTSEWRIDPMAFTRTKLTGKVLTPNAYL